MGRLRTRGLWLGLGLLVLLTPLGLLAPGEAWAEWGGDQLSEIVGFVPAGLHGLEGLWEAPLAGYGLGDLASGPGYVLSGLLGVGAVLLVTWLLGRWLSRGAADG